MDIIQRKLPIKNCTKCAVMPWEAPNVICHGQLADNWALVICQHCYLTFHPNFAFPDNVNGFSCS